MGCSDGLFRSYPVAPVHDGPVQQSSAAYRGLANAAHEVYRLLARECHGVVAVEAGAGEQSMQPARGGECSMLLRNKFAGKARPSEAFLETYEA